VPVGATLDRLTQRDCWPRRDRQLAGGKCERRVVGIVTMSSF
jgi:hypothetical protein